MNHEDTNHRPERGDGWRAWGRWLLSRNYCPHEWEDDYDFISSWVVVHGLGTAHTKDHVMQTMQWCSLCGAERRKPGSARRAQGMEAREGGDADAAPSRSDDSPVPPQAGCAQPSDIPAHSAIKGEKDDD